MHVRSLSTREILAVALNLLRETSWMNLFGTFGHLAARRAHGLSLVATAAQDLVLAHRSTVDHLHVLSALINESLLFTEPTVLVLLPAALFAALG